MDHDDATIGHIYSRREVLALGSLAGAALLFPWARAQTTSQRPLVASPVLTEGPFFVDEKLERRDLRGDSKRASVIQGLPLVLTIEVLKLVGNEFKPFEGATLDVWHCDMAGKYSDVSHPMNHENTSGQNWLRGFQKTDAQGVATFETIFPGWYPSRAPHIHFKIRKHSAEANRTADFTSQWFFDAAAANAIYGAKPYTQGLPDTPNSRDGIFNERTSDGKTAGSTMMLPLEKLSTGYASKFTVILTDRNFSTQVRRGGPGGRPPGGGDELLLLDWATF